MVKIKINFVILFALGINLVIIGNFYNSYGQTGKLNNETSILDIKHSTNSLNISKPIYQAISSDFFATQNVSSNPFPITKESVFEKAIMKDIGNVTNNMTFINTYLPDNSIQAKGNGTITTTDGQVINWISSDIGTFDNNGYTFQGIILFNSTNMGKLSFLNNTVGIYKETPDIKRTIWLLN